MDVLQYLDLEKINAFKDLLGAGLSQEVTKWTVALTIAAWIHSGRVKKSISAEFDKVTGTVTEAINKVSEALSAELKALRETIGVLSGDVSGLKNEVTEIKTRVNKLETKE